MEYQVAPDGAHVDELRDWERQKLDVNAPILNQRRGGGGRPPKILVAGEEVSVREDESIEDAMVREGLWGTLWDSLTKYLRRD